MITGSSNRRRGIIIVLVLIAVLLIAGFLTIIEFRPPKAAWVEPAEFLKSGAVIKVSASDKGRGLKYAELAYSSGDKTVVLHKSDLSSVAEFSIDVPVDFHALGIKEGAGKLTLTAIDGSLLRLGKGNSFKAEYPVTVDFTAPRIDMLSSQHIVLKGGAEAVAFRTSPDAIRAGVSVGSRFFEAAAASGDPLKRFVLFTYPYDAEPGQAVLVKAEDRAGNVNQHGLDLMVKPKEYRKRTIELSDEFLSRKVPELISSSGIPSTGELIKDFLVINKEVRKQNEDKLGEVTGKVTPEAMWEGGFLQMKNSAVEAQFADFRTYKYASEVVDSVYHLGVDLASTQAAPVEAANAGVVAFTGPLGIYGETVIIDHGLGLFTSYSHLSAILTSVGARVTKGAVIAKTGATGLAGGDHLHFGVFVHGTPVYPIEWWDADWIRKRISGKVETFKSAVAQ
jgi:murein DD-endopeptidase MepM/ murein hydrolase activator NlpD